MDHIQYFKLQAKNLFRDYKTQTLINEGDYTYFTYSPQFFDIDGIFLALDWKDEKDFSLMKAQHIISKLLGFEKWSEVINASDAELELARLIFDNEHKICPEDWEMYVLRVERENDMALDIEDKIEIFKHVFLNQDGHVNHMNRFRLNI